jgi:hypothetical protein
MTRRENLNDASRTTQPASFVIALQHRRVGGVCEVAEMKSPPPRCDKPSQLSAKQLQRARARARTRLRKSRPRKHRRVESHPGTATGGRSVREPDEQRPPRIS